MRLIDLKVLLELVKKNAPFIYSILLPIAKLCPTIEAEPVRHGRWIAIGYYDDDGDFCTEYKCPFCGRIEPWKEPYCHCGAKMDGGASDA